MGMLAPRTINQCPRCFQVIRAGTEIVGFGKGPRGEPRYAHKDCQPATAAEAAVLVGATKKDKAELDNLLAGVTMEVAHRPDTVGAQDATDGEQSSNFPGGASEPPPADLVKGGSGNGGQPTPAPGAPKPAPAAPAGPGTQAAQKGGMSPEQLAELKKSLGDAAGKFAAEALDKKITSLAAAAVNSLMPKFEAKVNAGAAEQIREAVDAKVEQIREEMTGTLEELRKESDKIVQEQLRKIEQVKEIKHVVVRPNKELVEFPEGEVFHRAFDEVLKLAGAGFNVFLPGPTGCGKTHLGKQVAHALGLRFGILSGSAGTTEAEFFGSSLPNITTGENVFQTTEFLDLYENGGLFLLDEADALDPNCFLKINAALANGYCAVPKRTGNTRAVRHQDFVCIAAANTWGQGATRMYCGRNKLDEATLDRFRAATVEMDYDAQVEIRYACPDVKLYGILKGWREKITQNQFQRVLSTRFMRDAYILHNALDYTVDDIARKLTGGWTRKEILAVIGKELAA